MASRWSRTSGLATVFTALVACGGGGPEVTGDSTPTPVALAALGAPCDPLLPRCDPATTDLCLDRGTGEGVCSLRCGAKDDPVCSSLPGGCCRPLDDGARGCFPAGDCLGTAPAGAGCPGGVRDCDPQMADRCVVGPRGHGFCTLGCADDSECASFGEGSCCQPLEGGGSVCAPPWMCALERNPGGPGTPCTAGFYSCDPARATRCIAAAPGASVCTVGCATDADCEPVFASGCCVIGGAGAQGCLPSPDCAAIDHPGPAGTACVGPLDCPATAPLCFGLHTGAPHVCSLACASDFDCGNDFPGGCCVEGAGGVVACLPADLCAVSPPPGIAGGPCQAGACDPLSTDGCLAELGGSGLCTLACAYPSDCPPAFGDGCCASAGASAAVCLPADACGVGSGPPGAACPGGFAADCDAKASHLCVTVTDGASLCTRHCTSTADCQLVFEGGCCVGTSEGPRVCMPASACAGGAGGPGAPCPGGFESCDPAAADLCLNLGGDKICTRRCLAADDCLIALGGAACCVPLDEGYLACLPGAACAQGGTAPPGAACPAGYLDDCDLRFSQACLPLAGGATMCAPACQGVVDCVGLFDEGACCKPVPGKQFSACWPAGECP